MLVSGTLLALGLARRVAEIAKISDNMVRRTVPVLVHRCDALPYGSLPYLQSKLAVAPAALAVLKCVAPICAVVVLGRFTQLLKGLYNWI